MTGRVTVVGLGPGRADWCLPAVTERLRAATDLVGYGPLPNESVRRVLALGRRCVAGNHDLIALGRLSDERCIPLARASLRWTRGVLDEDARALLSGLPRTQRLGDLVRRGNLILDEVQIVVIDEADRMADMGFLPDVKRILDQVRPDRQTLLFSATLDGDVDVLIKRYQRDPVRCEVEFEQAEADRTTHHFLQAAREDRIAPCTALCWPL